MGSTGHQRESHQHLGFCAPQEPLRKLRGSINTLRSICAVVLQADKNSEETSSSNSGTALMQGLMQRSSDLNSSGSNAISPTQLMVPAEDLIVPKCLPSLPEEVVTYNRNGRAQHVNYVLSSHFKSTFTGSSSCDRLEQLRCRFPSVEALLRTSVKAPTCWNLICLWKLGINKPISKLSSLLSLKPCLQ